MHGIEEDFPTAEDLDLEKDTPAHRLAGMFLDDIARGLDVEDEDVVRGLMRELGLHAEEIKKSISNYVEPIVLNLAHGREEPLSVNVGDVADTAFNAVVCALDKNYPSEG